jgi:hypothetical protein
MDCNNCTHLRWIEHDNLNFEQALCACPTQWENFDYTNTFRTPVGELAVPISTPNEMKTLQLCRFERKKKWF